MHTVLSTIYFLMINVAESDWAVHFIAPDGRMRVGSWLLFDSADEVRAVLRWAHVSAGELAGHERDIRRWVCSSVVVGRCRRISWRL